MGNQRLAITPANAVVDPRISDPQYRTLSALCLHTDANGWCFPALTTLAKILDKSEQVVSRDLHHIEACGYINIVPRFRPNGSQTSNGYQVRLDFPPDWLENELNKEGGLNLDDTPPSTSEGEGGSTSEGEPLTTQLTTQEKDVKIIFEYPPVQNFARPARPAPKPVKIPKKGIRLQEPSYAPAGSEFGDDDIPQRGRPKWSIPTTDEEKAYLKAVNAGAGGRDYWHREDRQIQSEVVVIIKSLVDLGKVSRDRAITQLQNPDGIHFWPRQWWDQVLAWAVKKQTIGVKGIYSFLTNRERLIDFVSQYYAAEDKDKVTITFDEETGGAWL